MNEAGNNDHFRADAVPVHTTGPWTAEVIHSSVNGMPVEISIEAPDTVIAIVESDDDGHLFGREYANARLIAAAPDMLAALRNVQKLISEAAMTGFNCHEGDWAERLFQSQQVTSAAIKKATTP